MGAKTALVEENLNQLELYTFSIRIVFASDLCVCVFEQILSFALARSLALSEILKISLVVMVLSM